MFEFEKKARLEMLASNTLSMKATTDRGQLVARRVVVSTKIGS
jgi:hypothetical protein